MSYVTTNDLGPAAREGARITGSLGQIDAPLRTPELSPAAAANKQQVASNPWWTAGVGGRVIAWLRALG